MDQEPESWIKAFDWTPEAPFVGAEPRFTKPLPAEPEIVEPRFESPQLREPEIPHVEAAPEIVPEPVRVEVRDVRPRFTPAPAVREASAPGYFLPRLGVGLAQGVLLAAWFASRATLDPYVFSGGLMVLLFAPLVLLAGMGRIRFALLLAWTLICAGLLAGVGAYHHWRTLTSDGGHPGLALLALTGLFLFIGQAIVQGGMGDYRAHANAAWRLAIRIFLCALVAALAWAAAGAAQGYMRVQYPALPFDMMVVPLVALSAAIAAQLTGEALLGGLQAGLLFVFTMALPFVLLLGLGVAGLAMIGHWQPSLALCVALAVLLLIAINASYRDGTSWRPYWQRRAEFAGALLLTPLTLIAAFALATRVAQHGWTDMRIFAVAGLLLMGFYALCYGGAALISLGGGGWMQRIEGSNLAAAFAGLMLLAALASPVADPAKLAVATQEYRLGQHKMTVDAFDYAWLRDHGLRFGHEALARMAAQKQMQAVAGGAFSALAAPPLAERPTPTEIGANIHVHGPGLPAGLLARDWSGVAGAPPCLTSAALICDAFFSDLDGDGRNEILLAYGSDKSWWASVMKQGQGPQGKTDGGWYVAGTLAAPPCPGSLAALRAGQFTAVRPAGNWRDLLVNGMRLSVSHPQMAEACPTT